MGYKMPLSMHRDLAMKVVSPKLLGMWARLYWGVALVMLSSLGLVVVDFLVLVGYHCKRFGRADNGGNAHRT